MTSIENRWIPKAGEEVEFLAIGGEWKPAIYIGQFNGMPVCGCEETMATGCIASKELRQRRTPEQIAAEERAYGINEMIRHVKDNPGGKYGASHVQQLKIQEDACVDLYDAGYRKQENRND
ncbi:hypothetical protein D3C76_874310 [compost metagenome]